MKIYIYFLFFLSVIHQTLQAAPVCKTCSFVKEADNNGKLICYENYVQVCNGPLEPVSKVAKEGGYRPNKESAAARRAENKSNPYPGGSGELLGELSYFYQTQGINKEGWETLTPTLNLNSGPSSPSWFDLRLNETQQKIADWEKAQQAEFAQMKTACDAQINSFVDRIMADVNNSISHSNDYATAQSNEAIIIGAIITATIQAAEAMSKEFDKEVEKAASDFNKEFIENDLLPSHTQKIDALVNQVNSARNDAIERLASAQSYIEGITVVPEDNFQSQKESIEGQAVRRANAYVTLAKENIEKSAADGKIPAEQLLHEAAQTLITTDKAYAEGRKEEGDYGISLVYRLTDAAIALAPIGVALLAPEALVAVTVVSTIAFAKDYYEFRSGKRLLGGEPLNELQRHMSGLGAVLSTMPMLGSALNRAMSFGKDAFEYARATRLVTYFSKAGKVTQEAEKITEAERAIQGVLDSAKEAIEAMGPKKFGEVLKTPKGTKPLPDTYLPKEYIEKHLAQFDDGASYLVPKDTLDTFGRDILGHPDNTQFVIPKGQMDNLLSRTGKDVSKIENELGLDAGSWQGKSLVRIDVPHPKELNVRIPSGNERGANPNWLPGGKLPNGNSEAVINNIPKGKYIEKDL